MATPDRFPYVEHYPDILMKKRDHYATLNFEVERMRKWALTQVHSLIRHHQREVYGPSLAYDNGYKAACADILVQLKRIK